MEISLSLHCSNRNQVKLTLTLIWRKQCTIATNMATRRIWLAVLNVLQMIVESIAINRVLKNKQRNNNNNKKGFYIFVLNSVSHCWRWKRLQRRRGKNLKTLERIKIASTDRRAKNGLNQFSHTTHWIGWKRERERERERETEREQNPFAKKENLVQSTKSSRAFLQQFFLKITFKEDIVRPIG